ncbi:hypothetical protein O0I10_006003 [Lichtheimia ornata]|uniref:CCHC-type domain-containing protein n=1 Tax=Lichtheimia ornata TaxID=688661 RepID=A0AAD7V4Y0_9FUNG|nr:uncharacterized protein O0I10_006003 [Lichtheimia ornata]KAJ8658320.1 hypothetical protein O0I10_006003 [Lichtheimia ornata]
MDLPAKPKKSVGGKPSHDQPSSYASLFNKTRESITLFSQHQNSRQVWRRAENPHSLLFDITHLKITDAEFRLAVGHSTLHKGAHGIVVHRTRSYTIAEVAFETQDLADKNLDQPVVLADGTKVFGSQPIPEEWDVVKINLTHIPLYTRTILSSSLSTALKPFGQLLELGIYLEQNFFTGKGYAYINTTPKYANNSNKVFHVPPQQLVHSITVSRNDGSYPTRMFATWSQMPLYCRYCHLSGHTRLQCKQKPQPRCHFCQELGHIRKDCQIRQGKKLAPETRTSDPANSNQDTLTSTFTFRTNSKRQRNVAPSKSTPMNITPTPDTNNNSLPATVSTPHDHPQQQPPPHDGQRSDVSLPKSDTDAMET